jgi:retron-type reverse transcriptase
VTVHAGRPIPPQDKSRELQRKLYLTAKRNQNRRFHALYDRLFRPDILSQAWEEVRTNGGSAGVDGVFIEDVEREGVEQFFYLIAQDLKAGTYRPKPVLRVFILKPDGKQRPLGIPAVRDRVVQQACKLVIEPIFEANFRENSYGFRPKRNAHQSVSEVIKFLNRIIRGWRNYFRLGNSTLKFQQLERYVRYRLEQWLRSKLGSRGHWDELAFRALLLQQGLEYFYLPGKCAV